MILKPSNDELRRQWKVTPSPWRDEKKYRDYCERRRHEKRWRSELAPAFVRSTAKVLGDATSSTNVSFGVLPAVGNHVIVIGAILRANLNTAPTDNQGHTYVVDVNALSGGGASGDYTRAFIASTKVVTSSGTFTVTVPLTASQFCVWVALEYSGLATASWLDRIGTNGGLATGANSASVAAAGVNSQADALVILALGMTAGDPNMNIVATGYTARFTENNGLAHCCGTGADKIVSALETSAGGCTHDAPASWAAGIATYRPAAGVGATILPKMMEYA